MNEGSVVLHQTARGGEQEEPRRRVSSDLSGYLLSANKRGLQSSSVLAGTGPEQADESVDGSTPVLEENRNGLGQEEESRKSSVGAIDDTQWDALAEKFPELRRLAGR